jgi:3-oxoacyl-[acyl-carrier protein] reductase
VRNPVFRWFFAGAVSLGPGTEEVDMRTVVVTGASSGIGLACARRFLGQGDRVVAQYLTQQAPVEQLAGEFGEDRVVGAMADLATEAGCVAVVAVAGKVDALVHSAGIFEDGSLEGLTGEALERMFRTNTFSAFFLAREAARGMERGSMTFIGSTAGQRGEPGHGPYAASKAALWGMVQSLAQELAPAIRVNLVSPGWVRTPMAESAFAEPGRLARIEGAVPLGRVAEDGDVAEAALFLSDDERARHLTGVDLPVSGGALLPMPRG